jgi:hypothetical protein
MALRYVSMEDGLLRFQQLIQMVITEVKGMVVVAMCIVMMLRTPIMSNAA